jgi:phage baseplate assembly protein gpV
MNDGELYKRMMQKTNEGLRVAMPARIEAYNPLTSMADVLVAIPQLRGDGSTLDTPIIAEVPVLWMRAGEMSITFPLNRGDQGLVIFCDYDIAKWATSLSEDAPQSLRRHNLTDAVFIPQTHGLKPSSTVGISIKNGVTEVLVTPTGVSVTAGEATVTAPTINLTGAVGITGAVTITGAVAITGGLTTDGKDFGTHTHGGVQTGSGNTGAPN